MPPGLEALERRETAGRSPPEVVRMTRPAEVTITPEGRAMPAATWSWCCCCGRAWRAGGATRIAGYTLCAGCGEALLQRVFFSQRRWTALAPRRAGSA